MIISYLGLPKYLQQCANNLFIFMKGTLTNLHYPLTVTVFGQGRIYIYIHPRRLRWNLRIHPWNFGKSSSKPPFPGSMLIFRGLYIIYNIHIFQENHISAWTNLGVPNMSTPRLRLLSSKPGASGNVEKFNWLVVSKIFYFHPDPWGNFFQFDGCIFFKGVGSTTNQLRIRFLFI